MADQPAYDPSDEQQAPEHSPIEEEFSGNEADTPAPRDSYTILGYSMSAVIAAVFVLFLILAAVAIFVT
ncbi:MAG: hypothetical protein R2849_21080 [Thermomicrobiales bacterium]